MSERWESDGATNVDAWLAAYAEDDNTFWRTQQGHIMNVVDELIDRLEAARAEIRRLEDENYGPGDGHSFLDDTEHNRLGPMTITAERSEALDRLWDPEGA